MSTLAAGTRVGPYEIVSLLGAGAMGEVCRARDLKLGRDVAIEILPSSVAGDRERLARFEREARLLASLNHRTGRDPIVECRRFGLSTERSAPRVAARPRIRQR